MLYSRELWHVHVLRSHLLHQILGLGTGHCEHCVHGGDVLHSDAPIGGQVIQHPLEDACLLRGRRHTDVIADVLADKEAVILVAALLVQHSGGHDAADWDIHVVGAEVLEVGHDCAGIAADDELGEGGHVDYADAFSANEVLFLNLVKEFRFAEGSLGKLCWRILPSVERVEVKWPLPTHPLPENGSTGLELAEQRGGADFSTATEFVDERILKSAKVCGRCD